MNDGPALGSKEGRNQELTVHLKRDLDPRRVWEALLEFEARLDRMIEEKTQKSEMDAREDTPRE